MNSVGGKPQNAEAVAFGGHNNAASAHFQVGCVGFGAAWTAEDSMAASIIRLEQENSELKAEVALLHEQARIMGRELDAYRDAACAESCREKESADRAGGNPWTNR